MQDRTDLTVERPQKQITTSNKISVMSKAASALARTAEPICMAFQCEKLQAVFHNAAKVYKRPCLNAGQSAVTSPSSSPVRLQSVDVHSADAELQDSL